MADLVEKQYRIVGIFSMVQHFVLFADGLATAKVYINVLYLRQYYIGIRMNALNENGSCICVKF